MSKSFVSGEERRRALAKSGVTVVANITKDRVLVAWAKDVGRAVYIGRNCRGWREAGWGNPFRAQTRTPEEHDRVIALYGRHLDENPILLGRLAELCGGKVLFCWCHPLPCHGDVLAKRANALRSSPLWTDAGSTTPGIVIVSANGAWALSPVLSGIKSHGPWTKVGRGGKKQCRASAPFSEEIGTLDTGLWCEAVKRW
jgi:hypothetical protein